MSENEQSSLLCLISPEDAANVIEDVPETKAVELVKDMPPTQAAAIMEELSSDYLVDVLGEMDSGVSSNILSEMSHDDAEEARKLLSYDPDSAGGLMISEFLAYSCVKKISDILDDLFWVLTKEAKVGLINGLVLGILLGGVAYLWKGNRWLGFVVGGALAGNTLISVSLGGMLPLVLKSFNLDPALVSGPLLTTVTDMCGFFFVLSLASAVLPKLGGI